MMNGHGVGRYFVAVGLACALGGIGCGPYLREELVREGGFTSRVRCAQGPFEFKAHAKGSRWGERFAVAFDSPRPLIGAYEVLVDGQRSKGASLASLHPYDVWGRDYRRDVAQMRDAHKDCVPRGSGASGATGAPQDGPASPGAAPSPSPPPPAPSGQSEAHGPLPTLDPLAPEQSLPHGRDLVWFVVRNDRLGAPPPLIAGTEVRIRFWFHTPADLSNTTFVFRHGVVRPNVSEEEWVAFLKRREGEDEERVRKKRKEEEARGRETWKRRDDERLAECRKKPAESWCCMLLQDAVKRGLPWYEGRIREHITLRREKRMAEAKAVWTEIQERLSKAFEQNGVPRCKTWDEEQSERVARCRANPGEKGCCKTLRSADREEHSDWYRKRYDSYTKLVRGGAHEKARALGAEMVERNKRVRAEIDARRCPSDIAPRVAVPQPRVPTEPASPPLARRVEPLPPAPSPGGAPLVISPPTAPPPPPRAEAPPPRPSANARWIAGFWEWTGQVFAWIPGIWEVPERDRRERRTVTAPHPPPPLPTEEPPEPPVPTAVWTAGYWMWDGARYVWVKGAWRIPPAQARWRPPSWIIGPNGVRFDPGGWKR